MLQSHFLLNYKLLIIMTVSSVRNQLIPITKKMKNKYLSLLSLIFLRNQLIKKKNLKHRPLKTKMKMSKKLKKKLKSLTPTKSASLSP